MKKKLKKITADFLFHTCYVIMDYEKKIIAVITNKDRMDHTENIAEKVCKAIAEHEVVDEVELLDNLVITPQIGRLEFDCKFNDQGDEKESTYLITPSTAY